MRTTKDGIRFHFLVPPFSFPQRNRLKAFLMAQFKKKGKRIGAINYIFCDDAYLLRMNQDFLAHDTYTDIITFELSAKKAPLLSDIYISIDRVRENAMKLEVTFKSELHRVIFHGALHLCNYKDKTQKQSQLMRLKENEWLNNYFISRETKPKKD